MLWDGPKKRDRTRSKSRLAQCGVKDPTKTGLAQSSKMSGQALHAWSLAGGSVAICSAASSPTYSRWVQLKSDQLPRAVANQRHSTTTSRRVKSYRRQPQTIEEKASSMMCDIVLSLL